MMKSSLWFSLILFLPTAQTMAGSCLPQTEETDIVDYVMTAPFAQKVNEGMKIWDTTSAEWTAARDAARAWANNDCSRFLEAARTMKYTAKILRDATNGHSYWVLRDNTEQPSYQGVFAFRAPEEVTDARPLVIDAPHMGSDYKSTDSRAIRLFRDVNAVAFLQNTAHRCSLKTISGCSEVTSSYACGAGGVRDSDVVHSVKHAYFAVYDGIESMRDDFHFEYHGAGKSTNAPNCAGTVHVSQASNMSLTVEEDEGTYPSRVWHKLEEKLGPDCVCYHQREKGCKLNGGASTSGRRTNAEAFFQAPSASNACLVNSEALARRFVHFEGYNIDEKFVIAALQEVLN
jgi:hypothetical protein